MGWPGTFQLVQTSKHANAWVWVWMGMRVGSVGMGCGCVVHARCELLGTFVTVTAGICRVALDRQPLLLDPLSCEYIKSCWMC